MEERSEAELFTLYWTQFFGRPVSPQCLEELWHDKRASGSSGGTGNLPVARLLSERSLKMSKMGKRSGVEFCRDAFTTEELKEILSSSDRFNWRYSFKSLHTWTKTAMGFGSYYIDGESRNWLHRSIRRHVIYRFGLPLARAVIESIFESPYRRETNIVVGNDQDLLKSLTRLSRELDDLSRHASGSPNYTSIVAFPEGMERPFRDAYDRVRRTAWTNRSGRVLLRSIALEEARALRDGTSSFEPETEAELIAYVAGDDFLHGESTGWAVERLNALRRTTPLTPWCTLLLQALAFWRRDFDTLKAVEAESPFCVGHKRSVTDALLKLAEGDYENAGKILTSAVGFGTFPQTDYWQFYDLPILLLLLIAKLRTEGCPGFRKLSRIIEGTQNDYENRSYDELGELGKNVQWAVELCSVASGESQGSCRHTDPTMMPFAYLRVLLAALDAGKYTFPASHAFALLKRAVEKGYPFVAADVAAILAMLPDEVEGIDEARREAASLAVDPAVALAALKSVRSHWENALDAVAKALGGEARANASSKKPKEPIGEFYWGLNVDTDRPAFVDRVFPIVRGALKSGKFGVPKVVAERAFIEGKYDEILSREDLELKSMLIGSGCLCADSYQEHMRPPLSLLQRLAERPNLMCCEDAISGYWGSFDTHADFNPMQLTCEKAVLTFATTGDGGAEISSTVPYGDLPERREYVMLRGRSDGSCWRVVSISKDFRTAALALSRQTQRNSLKIPVEGIERLEGLFASVADRAPVAWRRDAANIARNLPRETTDPKPCVRVTFADDALSVALAVRLSDEPLWSAEPGKGVPERLIVAKDASKKILVRDFAREEAVAAPAREALDPFDDAQVDDCHWYFSGLQDALSALSSLHESAEAGTFLLEWPEGEKLQLAHLVSHSARYEGGTTAEEWLSVSGTFNLDDGKILSFVDLLKSFDHREGEYVRLTEGRYLKLTASLARRVEALKGAGIERGGTLLISPAAIPSLEKVARESEPDDILPLPEIVKTRLSEIRKALTRKVPEPDDFKCQMRPYQQEGFEWLSRLSSCGIGACLADDMGLGKTIQLIALLLSRKKEGPSLVVAPASVAFNWRNEMSRFAPTLRVALIGQVANAGEENVAEIAAANDVVVTSYGVLTAREDQFSPLDWNGVVLDEAQAIKNHLTKRSKSVKTLKAKFRVVATGTPIENRLSELWSLFDFINPGMLGGETRFARELAPHGEATPRLKRLVKPLVLRRLKRDVLTDLPEKEEITIPVVLGDDERHAYEAVRLNAVAKLEAGDPSDKLAILAELTRLRRFCCHPSLVMPSVDVSAKMEALEALLESLRTNNHRALIFSQFVDYLTLVRKTVEQRGWSYKYLDGSTSKAERERSVTAFQAGEGDFFLISLKAGGMGLNLTAANYVILLDPWWNPAVENQAADRVHRIGQRLPVTVYRLIAQDTIEEKVIRLHEKKTALAEDVLANGASGLSAREMFSLLSQK